jgi:murein DD-endopeptidase MepM/ murein hydrolase activator NlpD
MSLIKSKSPSTRKRPLFRFHLLVLVGYWKTIVFIGVLFFLAGFSLDEWYVDQDTAYPVVETPPPAALEQSYPHLIPPRSTLFDELRNLGVNAKTIHHITSATKPVINLGRLRAGTRFRLAHITDPSSDLTGLEIQLTPVETIRVSKTAGLWAANRIVAKVETRIVTFGGVVRTNLWASSYQAKMDSNLIVQLAEIFAWQVDFAREVRLGDRWRLSVEQKIAHGKPVGWGSILAAEYQNGKQKYNAVLYELADGRSAYFAADGSSLRRLFLKSPIRYARITSRFQNHRFHPVLKISRPHRGIDYAAPTGTPVRALGDGVVDWVGPRGGGGNTIKVKHGSKYQSAYLHLSRFERGLRVGARVKQGQVIGYVGSTGMATGSHLHFELWVNGKVVDPLSVQFPSADPVPNIYLDEFRVHAANLLQGLPPWA